MLKRLSRWLIRMIVAAGVIFVIVIASRYLTHRYSPDSVIMLKLDGQVVERGDGSALGLFGQHQTAVNAVGRSLKAAEKDSRIVGLAIKVIDPQMQLAQAQELRAMIREFRAHGKWTTAYMETAGESGSGNLPYLVASSADEVSMMPQGELNLLGVGIREIFARGALDKLNIVPNFDAIGKYKDAGNIFTEKNFTEAQFEADDALVGALFAQITGETAENRHLSLQAVTAVINRAPITAADGLKSHLLDRLEYEDQFEQRVKNYRGRHHDLIPYQSYGTPEFWPFASHPKIAVIYGLGAIQRGHSGYDPVLSPGGASMGSDDIVEAFNDVRKDSSIRAVIFRINSPGGSVIASELIRRAVERCARKKPVVVSMSGYAASGGYWIATPAAMIFADPGTVTGSIGVLGGKFNIAGAAAAIGVNTGSITRGRNADMFDAFTNFTPEQAQIFHDKLLGQTYNYFLQIVAKRRQMTVEQVNEIAQGRVWTGEQAMKNRLVDRIGGFDAALNGAKTLAKIGPQERVTLAAHPARPGLLNRLLSGQVYGLSSQWRVPD
ncbi:MAG TPA: signal peptide peptidase SppA, partial [Candidatus Binataceae bacterium]|nr:signal peptide peptidase SppA [Candidatus Binataceae bacterium]